MDLDAALTHLRAPVPGPGPDGPPASEFARSPAAATVGHLARASGFFLFHYEHRAHLPVPDAWITEGREADAELPEWTDGVLPEPKYLSFRHDLPIGSFHPGHRAKWSTHELCHALVGFAWRPDATPLFHATVSRLAELVPVVLWYFLDEIGLRRCPRHREPQFRTYCRACADAAAQGPAPFDDARTRELLADASRFVDRELAAVARTVRTGVPHPHVYGSLDLCSDGIAYAVAHGPRLTGDSFHTFAEHFLTTEAPGFASTVDALIARVQEVFAALVVGAPLRPVPGGRARHVAQDLAQRLLQGVADRPVAQRRAATTLVAALAEGTAPSALLPRYAALAERHGWPPADALFAVGYPVDGLPTRSVANLRDGLATVTPLVLDLAGDAGLEVVARFAAADPWVRRPLGQRFADWLATEHPGPIAALGRFEASLRSASGEAEAVLLGPDGEGARWVDGSVRLAFDTDVPAFAEQVEAGSITGTREGDRLGCAPGPTGGPVNVVLARDPQGELLYVDLPPDLPEGWTRDPSGLGTLVPELLAAGVATPLRHRLTPTRSAVRRRSRSGR